MAKETFLSLFSIQSVPLSHNWLRPQATGVLEALALGLFLFLNPPETHPEGCGLWPAACWGRNDRESFQAVCCARSP